MSRLKSKQNKKKLYHAFFFIVLFFGLMFFFFTYGFQILINGSLFINQLSNNTQTKNSLKTGSKLNNIIVDPVPSATNSSSIIFSGSLLGYNMVEIYLNDEKVIELDNVSDTYSEEITGLEKGNNTVYAIAKFSDSNQTKKTNTFTVNFDNDKPTIEIESPKDGDKVNKEEITIIGKTNKETYIHINAQPVVIDAEGKFRFTLKLKEGENKIEITAADIINNTETKTITVSYSKDD